MLIPESKILFLIKDLKIIAYSLNQNNLQEYATKLCLEDYIIKNLSIYRLSIIEDNHRILTRNNSIKSEYIDNIIQLNKQNGEIAILYTIINNNDNILLQRIK